ncbi:MAG: hypothetical protein Q4B94_01720 [Pseudomonadota bacterium]|nr:hypothetical protein [Pseudomonadota bacterium]
MAIRITFPTPTDSPTGKAEVRVRYGIHRNDITGRAYPVLTYRGPRTTVLTPEAWQRYVMCGATVTADTEREKSIVKEILGVDIS